MQDVQTLGNNPCDSATSYTSRIDPRPLAVGRTGSLVGTHASALERGVKGGVWFSLIDKVYALTTLRLAWKKVRANKGVAGIDEQSIAMFEERAEMYLQ